MQKLKIIIGTFLFITLLTTAAAAQNFDFGGDLSIGSSYGLDQEEFINFRSAYNLELEYEYGLKGKTHLSFNGDYNPLEGTNNLTLDEAYTDIYLSSVDLTIGRQTINWGTADGINPTNNINPSGFNSFTNDSLKGEPILAAQGTYYGRKWDVTAVIIPDFVPQQMAAIYNSEMGMVFDNLGENPQEYFAQKEPKTNLKNMEYAFQAATRTMNYDLKFSYFHGFEDMPYLQAAPAIDPDTGTPIVNYSGDYRKVNIVGAAGASSIKSAGVWGEIAYIMPEEIEITPPSQLLSINEPYIEAVIGSDYIFENDVYLQAQYLYYGNGSLIIPYHQPGAEIEAGQYLMTRTSYDIDQKNKVDLTVLYNIRDNDSMIIPSYTHQLTQVTDLKITPIVSVGAEGEFSQIPDQLGISISTSF